MRSKEPARGLAVVAVVAMTAIGLTAPMGTAAEPPKGSIGWGGEVTWTGELTNGGALLGQVAGNMTVCPDGACDDFLLQVKIPPSRNPNRVRFVEITIAHSGDPLDLVIFPPGADPSKDWTAYEVRNEGEVPVARLLHPRRGVWRIQVRCSLVGACREATPYRGNAVTGTVRVPRAVAHHAGGIIVRSKAVAKQAPVARLSQIGANAWEPTLGISEEGTIFYQGWGPLQPPKVLRSTDGGHSWENVSPGVEGLALHRASFDPFIHVDEDTSRVFTVDMVPPHACNQLSFTEGGVTRWTTTAICEHAPDHQNLFTGPAAVSPTIGYPNVVYWCVNGNGFMTAACSKSLDGGLTFTPTGFPAYTNAWPVQENDECSVGAVGHGVVGPDGTVYLPRGHCGQPFLAISHDEGVTWTQVEVADNGMPVGSPVEEDFPGENVGEHETAVAVDEEGTLYYAWVAYDRLPYLAISVDGGLTWSDPRMVAPPRLNEAALPTLDVGAPGKVAIAYMGTGNSPGGPPFPGERQGSKDDTMREGYEGVTWNGYITMTTAALEEDPVFFTATVNDPGDPLVVGTCGPGRCARAGDFFDVVIGPDGVPSAAFVDACVVDRCVLVGEGIVGRLVGGPSLR